ncbi:hypothetical protein PENVUL_c033G07948 [Penicillium vulpinum]|uniref:Uncharacterized protein n=1 Tax=Penicillium vulpinum TaxID=29845 RepID=A0A1V6RSD2_9EURO|nr:hypothetical protein PENVUL_c033G07948 [Penicillium vulpinum]
MTEELGDVEFTDVTFLEGLRDDECSAEFKVIVHGTTGMTGS